MKRLRNGLQKLFAGYQLNDNFAQGHIDVHWRPRALHYILARKVSRTALHMITTSDISPLEIFVSDAQGNCIYTNATGWLDDFPKTNVSEFVIN